MVWLKVVAGAMEEAAAAAAGVLVEHCLSTLVPPFPSLVSTSAETKLQVEMVALEAWQLVAVAAVALRGTAGAPLLTVAAAGVASTATEDRQVLTEAAVAAV